MPPKTRRSRPRAPSLQASGASTEQLNYLSIDVLRLDRNNPRLPPSASELEEVDLLKYVAGKYNTIKVGESIARYGFFLSEPLIVVPDGDTYVTVEGNRRLTALKILSDRSLSDGVRNQRQWDRLELRITEAPSTVPCVVAQDRSRVLAIMGFRHISGIEDWDPPQQARFIAQLVDVEKLPLDEVAEIVGESVTNVRSAYRNHRILEQASSAFGLNVDRAEDDFGVFTRAMVSRGVRQYIGAPLASRDDRA